MGVQDLGIFKTDMWDPDPQDEVEGEPEVEPQPEVEPDVLDRVLDRPGMAQTLGKFRSIK